MKVYGELKAAQLENVSGEPATILRKGRMIYDGTSFKIYNGSSWANQGTTSSPAVAVKWFESGPAPGQQNVNGFETLDFDKNGGQAMFANITVPSDYITGQVIVLNYGSFFTDKIAGKVKMKAQTYLIEPGSTDILAPTNSHDSTNSEVSVSGTANQDTAIGDLQLTDGSGQINGQDVTAGDKLRVKLFRDIGGESSLLDGDARVLKESFIPNFNA